MSVFSCYCCQNNFLLVELNTCRMCNSVHLFCKEYQCLEKQVCPECGCQAPGNWMCGENDHKVKKGREMHKCVLCDEFWYCYKHLNKCPCGEGEAHYICKSQDCDNYSQCRAGSCEVHLCRNGQLIEGIRKTTFCNKHIPKKTLTKRLLDAADQEISERKLKI